MPLRSNPTERILDATVRLYCERGLEGTTIRDIVKEANTSFSTMHQLFPSKADLVKAALRRELAELDKTVHTPTGNFDEDLVALADRTYRFYRAHPFLLFAFPTIGRDPELQQILKEEQERTNAKLTVFWGFYRDQKRFHMGIRALDLRRLNEPLSTAFLGAIFTRVFFEITGLAEETFDPYRHTNNFLQGYIYRSDRIPQIVPPRKPKIPEPPDVLPRGGKGG